MPGAGGIFLLQIEIPHVKFKIRVLEFLLLETEPSSWLFPKKSHTNLFWKVAGPLDWVWSNWVLSNSCSGFQRGWHATEFQLYTTWILMKRLCCEKDVVPQPFFIFWCDCRISLERIKGLWNHIMPDWRALTPFPAEMRMLWNFSLQTSECCT